MRKIIFLFALSFVFINAALPAENYGQIVDPRADAEVNRGKRFLTEARNLSGSQATERLVSASQAFIKALEYQKNYFTGYYNLGISYIEQENYEYGVQALLEALSIKEKEKLKDATIYNSLGWAYMLAGNSERAEFYFLEGKKNESLLSRESQARLNNNLGWLYLQKGEFDNARPPLEKASKELGSRTAQRNLELLETQSRTKTMPSKTIK